MQHCTGSRPTVDADAIVAAFRAVTGWVAQDIAGSHVIAAPVERRISLYSSKPAPEPLKEERVDTSELVLIGKMTVGDEDKQSLAEVEFHMLYQYAHRKHPQLHEAVTGLPGHNDAYKLLKSDADLRDKYRELFAETGDEYIEPEFSVFDVIRDSEDFDDAGFVQE